MSRKTVSTVLLVIAIALTLPGLATLIPHASAPTVSDLGYYSMCPFAPWSTLTLLGLAGLAWLVRRHVKSLPVD